MGHFNFSYESDSENENIHLQLTVGEFLKGIKAIFSTSTKTWKKTFHFGT